MTPLFETGPSIDKHIENILNIILSRLPNNNPKKESKCYLKAVNYVNEIYTGIFTKNKRFDNSKDNQFNIDNNFQKINDCMEGIENRQIAVDAQSDTTGLSELDNLLSNYLTHRQIQNGAAYMVQVGQVFNSDGYLYFSTDGIKEFLRVERFNLGRTNLREELLRYGCEEGELHYTSRNGIGRVIKCWKKQIDDALEEKMVFYEDIYAQDIDRAATIELAKEKLKSTDDLDEDRF